MLNLCSTGLSDIQFSDTLQGNLIILSESEMEMEDNDKGLMT